MLGDERLGRGAQIEERVHDTAPLVILEVLGERIREHVMYLNQRGRVVTHGNVYRACSYEQLVTSSGLPLLHSTREDHSQLRRTVTGYAQRTYACDSPPLFSLFPIAWRPSRPGWGPDQMTSDTPPWTCFVVLVHPLLSAPSPSD